MGKGVSASTFTTTTIRNHQRWGLLSKERSFYGEFACYLFSQMVFLFRKEFLVDFTGEQQKHEIPLLDEMDDGR
jgi:hypothetical protein